MAKYPIILCGDHAEYEMQNANTPPEERSDWPLPSFDARDWAKAFVKIATENDWLDKIDEEIMQTWFAAALMRGYDEACARLSKGIEDERAACAQVASCLKEDCGDAIAAAIRLRTTDLEA